MKPDTETAESAQRWSEIAERSSRVTAEFWKRQMHKAAETGGGFQLTHPLDLGQAFGAFTAALWSDPAKLTAASAEFWQQGAELWESTAKRMRGEEAEMPDIPPNRRFRDRSWEENVVADYLRRAHLLTSEWMQDLVRDTEGVEKHDRERVAFYTRQFLNAASPANYAFTNPEVIQRTAETRGENLVTGLEHLLADLEKGHGELRITMTDEKAFEIGKNVATTPGKVVFENELMQLIQYEPSTQKVARRPILFVPPWINKFYVLDMQPKNSLIKWTLDQGHTVFVISWVNPRQDLAEKSFADYMHEGPLAALDAIEKATGERETNILGFCIGGILTAVTLAWLAAKGQTDRIASATFLATLFEFEEVGETSVFVDEAQVARIEKQVAKTGYLEGSHMRNMFSMMRENDLIWSFVVNNYLMGREPIPFDLLYWNNDSTRLPAAMLVYYLRRFYLENGLVKPGHLKIDDIPIDIGSIQIPCYVLATKDDHIAPWPSCYAATRYLGGPVRFVLGGSGHIAGIVNPPAAGRYCHWTGGKVGNPGPDWLKGAERHDGSWWNDWCSWLADHAGGEANARKPGGRKLKPIEDAPGSYVKVRAET